jgi:hypothetical protein
MDDQSDEEFDSVVSDPVREAGEESFPASDPPSSWSGGIEVRTD